MVSLTVNALPVLPELAAHPVASLKVNVCLGKWEMFVRLHKDSKLFWWMKSEICLA